MPGGVCPCWRQAEDPPSAGVAPSAPAPHRTAAGSRAPLDAAKNDLVLEAAGGRGRPGGRGRRPVPWSPCQVPARALLGVPARGHLRDLPSAFRRDRHVLLLRPDRACVVQYILLYAPLSF